MLILVGVGIFSVSLVTTYITMRKNDCDIYHHELIKLKIKVDMLSQAPEQTKQIRFDNITYESLRLVKDNAMTAKEIQSVLGLSREHIARVVKKMFDDGHLERQNARPYIYTITKTGLEMLG